MSINVGTINNQAPQAPQDIAGDGTTIATWVDATQVQNAEGTINVGQGINDGSSIVGTVRVGQTPTPDTIIASIATQTTPLKYTDQRRINSAGPIITNQ